MRLFLICMGIFALLLIVLSAIWKTQRKQRFRARLTIILTLFVAIPAMPLIFITTILVTSSADILLPVSIGEALNMSHDCIRRQLIHQGESFMTGYPDAREWNAALLSRCEIREARVYRIRHDHTALLIRQTADHAENLGSWQPASDEIRQRFDFGTSSQLRTVEDKNWFILYRAQKDSALALAGYPVGHDLVQALDKIETAMHMVNTLSLFRDSIVQRNVIWISAILAVFGLLVVAWMISQRLSREMTGPMQALVTGMERVADGDLSFQVETRAKDEFGYLIGRFNRMTADLKEASDRLLLAERLAAWQAVARQISHEIKNSLTPVALSIHRMRKQVERGSSSEIPESLEIIEEEMAMLKNMATEFSEFARMPEPSKSQVRINELAESAVHLFKNGHPGIRIHLNLDRALPDIEADRDQLKRVFNNLLKNAAEAMDGQGEIRVESRCSEDGKSVHLTVRDNGKGMPPEILKRIFQPSFTTKERGSGLGLAMVQKIVESHHGTIFVESAPGKGTTMTIRLSVGKSGLKNEDGSAGSAGS
ncbi:HAMP domain-containing protein [bacterium]|nr:HAMP domain-containing protein [bacterium]